MNLTKILTYAFFLISIGLAFFLFHRIKSEIDHKAQIAEVESRVIKKLEMIREAQVSYQKLYGKFTSDWDKLLNFIDTGKIYIVQVREEVIPLTYGRDTSIYHYDTLGSVAVQDSLFSPAKYPDFKVEDLPLIPEGGGAKFEMFADKITRGNVEVDVVEVKDVAPFDKSRKEDNEARNRKPLRFGSRTDVTIAGNWE